jgi:hypothetical protein
MSILTLRYFASEDPEEDQRKLELNNKVGSVLNLLPHPLIMDGRSSAESSVF